MRAAYGRLSSCLKDNTSLRSVGCLGFLFHEKQGKLQDCIFISLRSLLASPTLFYFNPRNPVLISVSGVLGL
jgi:hypothetical protein